MFFAIMKADDISDFEEEFSYYQINDPLISYNKAITEFNKGFYYYFSRPVLRTYIFLTPDFSRRAINNVFDNLSAPLRFSTNLLQFKFTKAKDELLRFMINSTIGFLGLVDIGTHAGIPKHQADFGLVLAHWGVDGGFHFVLPFVGPSNFRDLLTMPIDWLLSPTTYFVKPFSASIGTKIYKTANNLSFYLDTFDDVYNNTPNLYPFLRDNYEITRKTLSK